MILHELQNILDKDLPRNEKLLSEIGQLKSLFQQNDLSTECDDPLSRNDIIKMFKDQDYLGIVRFYNNSSGELYKDAWDFYVDALENLGFRNIAVQTLTSTMLHNTDDKLEQNLDSLTEKLEGLRIRSLYQPLISNLPIEIRQIVNKGKGVFSKKIISKGSAIFSDISLVCAPNLDNPSPETFCSLCSKSILTCEYHFRSCWEQMTITEKTLIKTNWPNITKVPCEFCSWEFYCSESCKTVAWDTYHKYLCTGKNAASEKLYELCSQNYQTIDKLLWNAMFSPMLIVKLLISKLSLGHNSIHRIYQNVKEELITFSSPKEQKIEKFLSPIHQLIGDVLEPWANPENPESCFEDFVDIYYKCATNVQSFNSPNYNTSTYQIFETNLSTQPREYGQLSKYIVVADEGIKDQTFCGLFLLHACLNHDCRPNARVEDLKVGDSNKIGVTIRSIRDIAIGEEITIPYIDTTMPKWVRQAWLFRAYDFKCQCRGCEFEGSSKLTCSNCNDRASEANDAQGLKTCGRCFRTWYCSKPCQVEHWKAGHKDICDKKESDSLTNTVLKNANIKLAL